MSQREGGGERGGGEKENYSRYTSGIKLGKMIEKILRKREREKMHVQI